MWETKDLLFWRVGKDVVAWCIGEALGLKDIARDRTLRLRAEEIPALREFNDDVRSVSAEMKVRPMYHEFSKSYVEK